MKIAGVACAFPPRQVSNQDILQMVRERSEAGFEGDLDFTLQQVDFFLNYIGIKHRRWLGDSDFAFEYTDFQSYFESNPDFFGSALKS